METKYNSLRYSSVCKVSSRTYNHNNNYEPTETQLEAAIIYYTYTKSTKYKSNPRSFIIKYQCETIQCDQSTRTNIHADCDCIEKTLNILIQACVGNTQHLKAHTAHDLR